MHARTYQRRDDHIVEGLPLRAADKGQFVGTDQRVGIIARDTRLRDDGAEPDPNTIFVEALRLQGDGYAVDAYLLFRFAARHGHGQAALLLGKQADPAYRDDDIPGSLKDQPEQAYKWYSIAAEKGIDEAATQLLAMRKRLEDSASKGDERAQRLLLLWD